MNKSELSGKWQQMKGKIKEVYGDLTDDEIEMFQGKKDQFFGRVTERYGIAKDQAENQLKKLETDCDYQTAENDTLLSSR